MPRTAALLAILTVPALASVALADFVTVDITPNVNADLRQYTGGWAYPDGNQTLDFGGVPMQLAGYPTNGFGLGACQIPGDSTPASFSFAVDIEGATTLYTLCNSAWGTYGAWNGTIEVFGSNGAHASFDLVQGWNIRDHYAFGGFNGIVDDPTIFTTSYDSGVRLDRQTFDLGTAFLGERIVELRFSGAGNSSVGAAFLAGATFATIPAPGACALLACAACVRPARRRR